MISPNDAVLEALDEEDFETAERHLRNIVVDEPGDAAAVALLALVVLAQDRHDEATVLGGRAVSIAPDLAFAQWALGTVLMTRNQFAHALRAAEQAIRLEPGVPDHHALAARAQGSQGHWEAALAAAARGLELDPEHVPSANVRALALRQLGRTTEADAAFEEVAAAAPLDAFANAGRAWTLLRQGSREDALEQFREALRLDPTNEWARDGLLATLKARNPIYRLFLKYYIWIGTRTGRQQAVFVVVAIILYNNLRRLARAEPMLAPVLWPLMAVYVLFLLGSWIADPLFDLLLSFDAVGRRALTPARRRAAGWVGGCLLAAITAALVALVADSDAAFMLAICAGFLLIPLAGTFRCEPGWPRTLMGSYTAALAVGAIAATLLPDPASGIILVAVVLGAALGSWLARWLETVLPAR